MSGSLWENWPSNVREEQRRKLRAKKRTRRVVFDKADWDPSLTCKELRARVAFRVSRMKKVNLCDVLRYIAAQKNNRAEKADEEG
jgi:uncharacterized protein with WD repeat